MPLTDGAVQEIKRRVPDWARPVAEIDALVNGETIPNPVPQEQLPRQLSWYAREMVLDLVSNPTVRSRIKAVFDFAEGILGNDKTLAAQALSEMVSTGVITTSQRAAIINWAQETIPDPLWRPNISWAEATLGRKIDFLELDGIRRSVHDGPTG